MDKVSEIIWNVKCVDCVAATWKCSIYIITYQTGLKERTYLYIIRNDQSPSTINHNREWNIRNKLAFLTEMAT